MPYNAFQNSYQPYYPQFSQGYGQQYQQTPYMAQIQPQNQQMANLPQNNLSSLVSPKFDVVQGELAASMYQAENGQEVILIDRDNPFVYKRKRTADGKLEPLEKYKLVKVEDQEPSGVDMKEFVRQEEIGAIVESVVKNEIEKKFSEMTLKPSTRKKGEE